MTPTPTRMTVIVGLFITIAIAILAGAVLTIGNLNDTFSRKVTVSAVFSEVNGLKKGDNIWYSGLKVGTVSELAFHDGSKVRVEMRIDQNALPFIHRDALAKLSSDGLIGSKIVVLYGGTPTEPVLKDGDVIAIGEAVSTEAIMTMLQENNTNLLAITTDLKSVTAKIVAGEGTVGKLLTDDALYDNVTTAVTTLNSAAENARTLTASLSTFSAKLNKPGTLPHDLVTDTTTMPALKETVTNLRTASTNAASVVDNVNRMISNPGSPIGTLLQDNEAGGDLKQTLANLSAGSVLLNQDLEAIQHNFLFRGYFRKQEKEAKKEAAAAAK